MNTSCIGVDINLNLKLLDVSYMSDVSYNLINSDLITSNGFASENSIQATKYTDISSFGLMLIEIMSNYQIDSSNSKLIVDCPEDFEALILLCCDSEPNNRPSIEQVIDELILIQKQLIDMASIEISMNEPSKIVTGLDVLKKVKISNALPKVNDNGAIQDKGILLESHCPSCRTSNNVLNNLSLKLETLIERVSRIENLRQLKANEEVTRMKGDLVVAVESNNMEINKISNQIEFVVSSLGKVFDRLDCLENNFSQPNDVPKNEDFMSNAITDKYEFMDDDELTLENVGFQESMSSVNSFNTAAQFIGDNISTESLIEDETHTIVHEAESIRNENENYNPAHTHCLNNLEMSRDNESSSSVSKSQISVDKKKLLSSYGSFLSAVGKYNMTSSKYKNVDLVNYNQRYTAKNILNTYSINQPPTNYKAGDTANSQSQVDSQLSRHSLLINTKPAVTVQSLKISNQSKVQSCMEEMESAQNAKVGDNLLRFIFYANQICICNRRHFSS